MESSPAVIETLNGRVQVSAAAGDHDIGLLVERAGSLSGVLLTPTQAQELADVLLDRSRFSESAGT